MPGDLGHPRLFVRGAFARQCAIVTGPDPHRFALNESLASFGRQAGFELQVFHEMHEALEWLADRPASEPAG